MQGQIQQLEEDLKKEKSEIDSLKGQLDFIEKSIIEKTDNIEKLKIESEVVQKAVELLQLVQRATREKTKQDFETIVTHALRSVFNKDIKLELEFGRRGNLPELNLNIQTPECTEFVDLLDSESGGIINIVAMALRLVLLEISVPKIEGFLVLDEKFNNVSEEYLENTVNFLKEINKKLNRQIIWVTHTQGIEDTDLNTIRIGE